MADGEALDPEAFARLLRMYQGGALSPNVDYAATPGGGLEIFNQSAEPGSQFSQFDVVGRGAVPVGGAQLYGSLGGSQQSYGQEKMQRASPEVGVSYGPLDLSAAYDVNRWAGYGDSDTQGSKRFAAGLNAPIGEGHGFARVQKSDDQKPTYSAGYRTPLGGGDLAANVDADPARKMAEFLLTYSKRF